MKSLPSESQRHVITHTKNLPSLWIITPFILFYKAVVSFNKQIASRKIRTHENNHIKTANWLGKSELYLGETLPKEITSETSLDASPDVESPRQYLGDIATEVLMRPNANFAKDAAHVQRAIEDDQFYGDCFRQGILDLRFEEHQLLKMEPNSRLEIKRAQDDEVIRQSYFQRLEVGRILRLIEDRRFDGAVL